MGVHGGPDIITDGLILCLDAGDKTSYSGSLQGGTLATWTDLSGNGNDGTIDGQTFDGGNGGSLDFSSDYVVTGCDIGSTGSPFSISAWGNTDTISGWHTLLGTQGSMAQIGILNTSFYSGRNGGSGWWLTTTGVTVGKWNSLTLTYSGTVANFYVNGVHVDGPDTNSYGVNHGQSVLGAYGTSGGETWDGKIASAKIYNRVLSAKEVSQNFNAQRSRFSV